jgi:hypothetical protein
MKKVIILSVMSFFAFSAMAQYVDLGLSVKWAVCNLGAQKPEDPGYYYAWGEIQPKESYCLETYKFYQVNEYKVFTYGVAPTRNYFFIDYYIPMLEVTSRHIKSGVCNLKSKDDAATANCGANWRMPTNKEWEELIRKCKWTWSCRNGVWGYIVTSRQTQNSIFLPASGFSEYDILLSNNACGRYWASSANYHIMEYADALEFSMNKKDLASFCRWIGFSVRPVCP